MFLLSLKKILRKYNFVVTFTTRFQFFLNLYKTKNQEIKTAQRKKVTLKKLKGKY